MKFKKPKLVVISEKRHLSPQDGKLQDTYQSSTGSYGLSINIEGIDEEQNSLTTRNGHHILIVFSGVGEPKIYADKNQYNLLSK